MSSDICRLVGDSLSFKSESVSKGAMADMVIQKNLGQALTGQNLVVFQVVIFKTVIPIHIFHFRECLSLPTMI